MKLKFFNHALLAIAAAGSLASCQNEMDCPGPKDGVRPLTFCTKLPVGFTRAFADGNTADVLTCYVYDSTGKTFLTEAQGTISGGSGQVTVQLVGNENYKILFWAANSQVFDAKQPQSTTMPYKINPETGELSVDYAQVNGNSDKYDAFYTVIDVTGGANATQEIDLRRAFAQVNVGTDDSELPVVKEAYKSVFHDYPLIYTEAAIYGVCNRVNLVANTAQSSDTTTLKVKREQMNAAATGAFSSESFPVAATPVNKYTSMAYVLASPIGSTVNVGFKAFNTDQPESEYTAPVQSMMIPSAPIKTNWRTNIYGSLLSSKSNFQVDIQPNIQGTEKDVIIANNITQLSNGISAAVAKGETAKVSLGADMADQVLTIPAATTPTVIDLETNGKAIPAIVTAENVTINIYENFPTSKPASKARRTRAAQALFTANNNSTINIYGGSYESDNMFATADNGAINVYGGSFKGVAKATLEGYVPEGKYVTNGDNGFLTITNQRPPAIISVSTASEFKSAVNTLNTVPNSRIIVSGNITLTQNDMVSFSGTGSVLEIAENKILSYESSHETHWPAESKYLITISNGADLKIVGPGTFNGNHNLIKVLGNLTIEGAKITSDYDNELSKIWINGGTVNYLNGSSFIGQGNLVVVNNGSFNMSGGLLKSTSYKNYTIASGVYYSEDKSEATHYENSSINISGGTIQAGRGCIDVENGTCNISGSTHLQLIDPVPSPSEEISGYCLYIDGIYSSTLGTIPTVRGEITGGTFDGRGYMAVCMYKNNLKFKGGKYAGGFALYDEISYKDILGEGYTIKDVSDGIYTQSIVPVSTEPAAKRRR